MGGCIKKSQNEIVEIRNKQNSIQVRDNPIDMEAAVKSATLQLTDYYLLKKVIGQGGFGVVRRGCRIDNPTIQVAIKTIKKSKVENKLEDMKNEVNILSTIDHPNIVKLYEYFDEEYFFHIVTEFCGGGELFDRVIQNGRINEADVVRYMKTMISSINHLHKIGICHRDIKPQNFIFESELPDAQLKLIDFGLAHKFQQKKRKSTASNLTSFAGTSFYTAPEIVKGSYDSKCDIWSLGVIMDLMLTGTHPFTGATSAEIYHNIINQDYDTTSHEYSHISKPGIDLLQKLLNKNPSARLSAEQALAHPWMSKVIEEPADLNIIRNLQKFKPPTQMWSAAMGILVKYMSAEELKGLRIAFNEIDVQGTGFLSLKDIKLALKKTGIVLPKRELLEIFKRLDFMNNGIIQYSEFLTATVSSRIQVDELMMWTIFNTFDIDKNGQITLDNLRVVFKRMGLVYTDEKIANIIKEVTHSNTDGINFEEFKAMMQQKAIL